MSWSLKRNDVALRVTKFAPVTEPKPIAGLTVLERTMLRYKRVKECRRVAPAIELNSKS